MEVYYHQGVIGSCLFPTPAHPLVQVPSVTSRVPGGTAPSPPPQPLPYRALELCSSALTPLPLAGGLTRQILFYTTTLARSP